MNGGHHASHRIRNHLNPDHLFPGSPKANTADMISKGRQADREALSQTCRKAWTSELRAMRSVQTKERMRRLHDLLAEEAGVPVDWKYCPRCKTWYPRSDFVNNKARHDGLSSYCATCERSRLIEYARNHAI